MRTTRPGVVVLLWCCAASVAACTSVSTESSDAAQPGLEAAAAPAGAPGGVPSRVFVDPATGQPREPTPAELADLERRERTAREAARGNAKPDAPAEFRLPDGTVGVRFPGDASQPLQACLQPDGSVDAHCHTPASAPAAGRHAAEDHPEERPGERP